MSPPDSPPPGWRLLSRRTLAVRPPYRLDLTALVLRRTAANLVDVLPGDGRHLRAFLVDGVPYIAVTRQTTPAAIEADLYMPRDAQGAAPVWDPARVLGTAVDLTGFYVAAAGVPGLVDLAEQARGVKPPRYPTLWEALCNAVVFQQVSLEAASATMGRLIRYYAPAIPFGAVTLYPFPPPAALPAADPLQLRGLGLSSTKARALQEIATLLGEGRLAADALESLPTPAALERLTALRGIGPWTAAVVMLRGFGRLDVFPAGDSGARRSMRGLLGIDDAAVAADAPSVLAALGPWRGMLYYHLLLWRLQQRAGLRLAATDP